MGDLSAFIRPQKSIERAKQALYNAKKTFFEFMDGQNIEPIQVFDQKTGYYCLKTVITGPVPDNIEAQISSAVTTTRHAFDQIIFSACEAIGKPTKGLYYPWVDEERLLAAKLFSNKQNKEIIPADLWDVIRAQEPYPHSDDTQRGNTLIRNMAILANRKHTVGIEIGCFPAINKTEIEAHGYVKEMIFGTEMIIRSENLEFEFLRWKGQSKFNYRFSPIFHIIFNQDAPGDLGERTAMLCVQRFIEAAQKAIDDFRQRAKELAAI
ncbi:hypothetical protein [Novosphingobium sp.]|uniref:hypothetical protein n=1 Tax=Novosphingobium sp. TaxID=1874826 RepID=UPI003BAC46B4